MLETLIWSCGVPGGSRHWWLFKIIQLIIERTFAAGSRASSSLPRPLIFLLFGSANAQTIQLHRSLALTRDPAIPAALLWTMLWVSPLTICCPWHVGCAFSFGYSQPWTALLHALGKGTGAHARVCGVPHVSTPLAVSLLSSSPFFSS